MKLTALVLLTLLAAALSAQNDWFITELPYYDLVGDDSDIIWAWDVIPAVDGGWLVVVNNQLVVGSLITYLTTWYHLQDDGTLDWSRLISNAPLEYSSTFMFDTFALNDSLYIANWSRDRFIGVELCVYDAVGDCIDRFMLRDLFPEPGWVAFIHDMRKLDDKFVFAGRMTPIEGVPDHPYIAELDFDLSTLRLHDLIDLELASSSIKQITPLNDENYLIGTYYIGNYHYYCLDDSMQVEWELTMDIDHSLNECIQYDEDTLIMMSWTIPRNDPRTMTLYRVDRHTGEILHEVSVELQDYSVPFAGISKPAQLLKLSDGNLLLFYSYVEGELHKLDPDFNIIWSREVFPDGTHYYTRMIGKGDQAGRELDSGDILFAASYISQADPPAVLVRTLPDGTPVTPETAPPVMSILTAYPNPFNPETTIRFSLEEPSEVNLAIYNVRGQYIETLLSEHRQSGAHSCVWKPTNLASGVYFARLTTEYSTQTRKLLLMK